MRSIMPTTPTVEFHDGQSIPQLGFGVWQVANEEIPGAISEALKTGFRHIDTAKGYGNEAAVGTAIKESGLPREDVFVTSKLPNQDQGYESGLASFESTIDALGLDVLDLYLIHWPAPEKGLAVDTWKALVELKEKGRIRSIGVSNFRIEDLEQVEEATGVRPVINQIELHPYFNQPELRAYHAEKGIATEAWSPLGQGGGELTDPVITKIAEAHGATPAQVVIAWNLALGDVVIPKSVTPARIAQNFGSLEVTLTGDEIDAITALHKGEDGRQGGRPDQFAGRQGA
jgi:2,5-diketo-D-gluconate reductase A